MKKTMSFMLLLLSVLLLAGCGNGTTPTLSTENTDYGYDWPDYDWIVKWTAMTDRICSEPTVYQTSDSITVSVWIDLDGDRSSVPDYIQMLLDNGFSYVQGDTVTTWITDTDRVAWNSVLDRNSGVERDFMYTWTYSCEVGMQNSAIYENSDSVNIIWTYQWWTE